MGVDYFKCHGCDEVINDHGDYPRCELCRHRYHDEDCGEMILDKNDEFVCSNCQNECEFCNKNMNVVVLCEKCENQYCEDCFAQYFDTDPNGTKLEIKDTDLDFYTMPVSRCVWCSISEEKSWELRRRECAEGACAICWKNNGRHVIGTSKVDDISNERGQVPSECVCGLKNLCKPHTAKHQCEARILRKKRDAFIEQNEDAIREHIFKKVKTAGDIETFCADLEGFPK